MIVENLGAIYTQFKLNFYRQILKRFDNREATLTALEIFCVETIHAMNQPTINKFAEFLQISQANAAYKVGKLVGKGYVNKVQSKNDKREFFLDVTEKFANYYNINTAYMKTVAQRINERFCKDELKKLDEFLNIIATELMPEVALCEGVQ